MCGKRKILGRMMIQESTNLNNVPEVVGTLGRNTIVIVSFFFKKAWLEYARLTNLTSAQALRQQCH